MKHINYIKYIIILFIFIFLYIMYKYIYKNEQIENFSNTGLNVLYTDQNGNLSTTVLIASRTIAMWRSMTPPPGWAICDGSRGTPDLRGRFILCSGQGEGLTNRIHNTTGGTESETLSIAQIPSHNHNFPVGSRTVETTVTGTHSHFYTYVDGGSNVKGLGCDWSSEKRGNTNEFTKETSESGSHTHTATVDFGTAISTNTGSGFSHDNMPPYYVLTFIMKL